MKKSTLSILLLLVVVLAGLAFFWKKASSPKTLFLAGDTMIARWAHREAFEGSAERMFGNVLPHIQKADLAFVNLECVLSDRGFIVDKGESRPFPYRARPEMVRFLSSAGLDIVTQANNHAGDYGPDALLDSIQILKSKNILPLGLGIDKADAERVHYEKVGNLILAWIAFTTQGSVFEAQNDLPGTFYVKKDQILSTIAPLLKEAHKRAHLVIVTPHWGSNWKTRPTKERQEIARKLIDGGADMIAGHSSHVLQGMEIYKNRPILYDLGSFLFDSTSDRRLRNSMFFEIQFSIQGITKIIGYPISLYPNRVDLAKPARAKKIIEKFLQASAKLGNNVKATEGSDSIAFVLQNKNLWEQFKSLFIFFSKPVIENGRVPTVFDFLRKPPCVVRSLPEAIDRSATVEFENGMKFEGCLLPRQVSQGTSFLTRLYFSAQENIRSLPCEIWVYLFPKDDRMDKLTAYYSHEPGDWSYPVNRWRSGEIVEDISLFRPPKKLPLGFYDVYLKIQALPLTAQSEVKVKSEAVQTPNIIRIGTLEVVASEKKTVDGLMKYSESHASYA